MHKDNKQHNDQEKWVGVIKESGDLLAKMPPFIQHCVGISFICFSCLLSVLVTCCLTAAVYYFWKKIF